MNDQTRDGCLPQPVLELFAKNGVATDGFLYAVTGDMDNDGAYTVCWIAFDKQGLYIATGAEKVIRTKKKHRLETQYRLDTLRTIPFGELDRLDTERYVSTGRLVGKAGEETESITRYSIGLNPQFSDFVKAFNTVKEGGDLKQVTATFHESPFCPKCGQRYPDPNRKICPRCMDKTSTVKRLLSFFGGYKLQVAFILGSLIIGTAISLVTPQISTRTLYDQVLNPGNLTPMAELLVSLAYMVLAIVGIRLLRVGLDIVFQWVTGSILPWVINDIMLKIFRAMQRLGVSFYTSKQTGSLMERVTDDANSIYWFFVDGMPQVIMNSVTLLGVLIIMALMNWQLTLVIAVAFPLVFVVFKMMDKMWHRMHHRQFVYRSELSSMVSDNINGQRVIKAFAREDEENNRFARASGNLMRAEIRLGNTESTAYPLIYLFIYAVTAIVLAMGSVMVVKGQMSLGTLLSFTVYIDMLHEPMDFLAWVSDWWARCFDASQRVFEVVDSEPDVVERENPVVLPEFRGSVNIRELEFEYEPARPVIKKLDLSVEAGTMLGIVGKTGAGKTTIANLIARLYDAKAGAITIDGVDVKDLSLKQLRQNIGLVSQEIYLFMGTIADNIRYARPDASIEEVISAAKAASAHEFIMRLPDGYETRVGAGGQDLSGGERQRVSIARTIIQNPKILILDEATAAMDTETERHIQESLTKLKAGRTTIAIAHRLSTLRDADRLAVIEDGKVVESGSFRELMLQKGEYYKLYQIQSEALKNVNIGED